MSKAAPKKIGRPSKFTPAILQEICERLAKGEPLARICADEIMPADRTVREWTETREDVSAAIARAREFGFDVIAADALSIADTPEPGVETTTKPDGSVEVREGDMLGHRKLRIETRLKLLAKWDPKRYGDQLALNHSGAFSVTLQDRDAKL